MKDESKEKINIKFFGLKSKMYFLLDVGGKENKREKGVNNVVVENIKHQGYLDVLINKKIIRHIMKRIQSKLELIKFAKFLCLVLMMKNIYLIMVLILWLIFLRT